ncbi:MAG: type I methionyl aminopeptidase [Deltaproteobacteria bacterium]|nr:type I methionyl aminopeptidase [Deltaproteobacteria bacterium]
MSNEVVILKSAGEIDKLRRSNVVVAEMLELLRAKIAPGVTTMDLEMVCVEELEKRKITPAFKGYRGYPFCLCTSVNDEVVHGMPSERVLNDGDIISIDFGVNLDGFYGDSAVTIAVGNIAPETQRLMDVTSEALNRGIAQALDGNRLFDISSAVQQYAEDAGFSVVRTFVGHGIGKELHEPPQVPNFGQAGKGIRLKAGMVLAIEPMINQGTYDVKVLKDGWTAVTNDGKLSAHFEHTIAITKNGPYVLSRL